MGAWSSGMGVRHGLFIEYAFSFRCCWALARAAQCRGGIRGLSGGVIKTEGGKKRVLTILRICLIARRYGGSSGRNHTSAGRLVWLLSGHRSRVAEGGESLIAGNC